MLRKATKNDVKELVSLINSAYRGETSHKGWTTEAEFLDGQRTDEIEISDLLNKENGAMLIYEIENKIEACCFVENVENDSNKKEDIIVVYLGMLTVNPNLQGNGLGKIVIKRAEDWIQQFLHDSLTDAATNQKRIKVQMTVITLRSSLIEFYERRGFKKTGKLAPFPYGDARKGIPLRNDLQFEYLEKYLN